MVDYCLSQSSLFGASDISDNLLSSDPESSCASTDLNSLLYLDFDEDQFTEEMINNVGFNQNSNNSTCSTNSSQTIYNSPAYTSLANGFSQTNQCAQLIDQSNPAQLNSCGQAQQLNRQQQQPLLNTSNMVVNSLQDSQFAMMSNGSFASSAGNPANPLLSYSTAQANTNELVRIQNECVSMSPTCSNTSSVSSHTLPSFMDTYSSAKLNAAAVADINASIIEESGALTGCAQNPMPAHVSARSTTNGNSNLNGPNHNLDENFDSDDLLYELGPNEFCDDQSYSNSSFSSVNLPTPPTTSAELVTMTNCQTNPIFNLASSNCSSSMLVNTPVPTPLNGMSNCSSPISSIQDISNKPMKFKQEPLIEYDCNNNLTVLNQANNALPMNNLAKPTQPSTSVYSPSASLFNGNKQVDSSGSMLYSDFNSFDLDIYPKNELTSGEPMNCMNSQSIMSLPDQSRLGYPAAPHPFNTNRLVQQTQPQSHLSASGLNKCTTLNANKKLSPSLLQMNQQMNQMNQQQNNKCLYQNQTTNRLKFAKNPMMLPDSSNYKFKQINQFAQQLNSAKFGAATLGKTSMVCLVCGDQANCCHYKVVTCEGCKGFFKRTVQKGAKYTCLGNKDCVVDKRRRNRCQYCRYQKCLAVGMQKNIVRTDNLKGRRGRLPSKAKFPINVASNSPSIEFIRPLLEKLIKNYPTLKKPKQTLYQNENDYLDSLSSSSMEYNGVNQSFNNNDYLRNEQFSKFGHDKQQIINQFKQIALEFTNDFARQIPGFGELDENDRKILISNSSVEVFTLFFAYRHSPGLEVYEFDDNFRLSRNECEKVFGQWFRSVEELMGRLQNMQIDLLSFTYLLSIVILYGYSDLNNCDKVDKIQNKLVNSLKDFTDKDIEAQKKSSYFPRLLNLLPDLKNLKTFVDDYQTVPLQFY